VLLHAGDDGRAVSEISSLGQRQGKFSPAADQGTRRPVEQGPDRRPSHLRAVHMR